MSLMFTNKIVTHNSVPVFIKFLGMGQNEVHLVLKHVASCEYDDEKELTTITMVNGTVFIRTTPTRELYTNIIRSLAGLYSPPVAVDQSTGS